MDPPFRGIAAATLRASHTHELYDAGGLTLNQLARGLRTLGPLGKCLDHGRGGCAAGTRPVVVYNLIQIRDIANAQLKLNGLTTAEITRRLLREVQLIAADHDADPAWVTVAVRANAGTNSAYFALVASLGLKRSVPMTVQACRTYECLANDLHDHRLTPDLLHD